MHGELFLHKSKETKQKIKVTKKNTEKKLKDKLVKKNNDKKSLPAEG